MKKNSKKYPRTVAGLIAQIYDTCGKQNPKGIIQLASKAHFIRLGGRYVEFV